ncbi:MAG: Hsp20/alpha crystallin family protein [Methanomassiliicoccus sp.]|nr:Hsp20/alpha crystallin family protein [Methanomassiliicoccus sp.]
MKDDKRKRRRTSWDDLFGNFDEEFEEMRERMDAMMEGFMNGRIDATASQPIVYGFSMRMGPDGKPHIQEFGNAPPEAPGREGAREPLTDIIEEKERIRVIVELPGVERDDIQLNVEDRLLDISVDREDRKFSKKVEMPSDVDPDSASASYKNGVLEVTLRKVAPKKRGRPVKIEDK